MTLAELSPEMLWSPKCTVSGLSKNPRIRPGLQGPLGRAHAAHLLLQFLLRVPVGLKNGLSRFAQVH